MLNLLHLSTLVANHKLTKKTTCKKSLREQIFLKLKNPEFQEKLSALAAKTGAPSWTGELGQSQEVGHKASDYSVLAVDGSQIWPDRHSMPHGIALIQIGGIYLNYGQTGSADYFSELELVSESSFPTAVFDKPLVEQYRDLRELETALLWAANLTPETLIFMDGSLSFLLGRFTDSSSLSVSEFGPRFLKALRSLAPRLIFYTSLPGSRNLSKLFKIAQCSAAYFDREACSGKCGQNSCRDFFGLTDSGLFSLILPDNSFSQVFEQQEGEFKVFSQFCKAQGTNFIGEVGKVESLQPLTEAQMQAVLSQCHKGFGYPVSISQAHNTAVLTERDKGLFLALLERDGDEIFVSRKLESKRA